MKQKGMRTKIQLDSELRLAGIIKSYEELKVAVKNMFGEKVDKGYTIFYKSDDKYIIDSEHAFRTIISETTNSLLLSIKFDSNTSKTVDGMTPDSDEPTKVEEIVQTITDEELKSTKLKSPMYNALIENNEDGKTYIMSPGETMKLTIYVFNNGTTPFPEDTVLSSLGSHISKSVPVGVVESGKRVGIEIELKAPFIPKIRVVQFRLSCSEGEFGDITAVNIKIAPIPELENFKSKDVMKEISKIRTRIAFEKYNVVNEMQENFARLINIFVCCGDKTILESLKKNKNDFISTAIELYMLTNPKDKKEEEKS